MISDVVQVAWTAVGCPRPAAATGPAGVCARCGRADTLLSPVRRVLSRNFSGFDDWARPALDGLCQACTWAYQTPLLRSVPHLVVRQPEMLTPLTRSELATLLTRPMTSDEALVVPLRPGRQHVVAGATWGGIATDHLVLTWTAEDVTRLGLVQNLRGLGCTLTALLQPAPPYQVVTRAGAGRWQELMDQWEQLQPWRSRETWMQLAMKTAAPADITVGAGQ